MAALAPPVPSSGQQLPRVGLGSWLTFNVGDDVAARDEADAILRRAGERLFKEHKDDPIHVIKWKEIYETLETATDRCEDVANIIEGVVLENA